MIGSVVEICDNYCCKFDNTNQPGEYIGAGVNVYYGYQYEGDGDDINLKIGSQNPDFVIPMADSMY